MAYLLQQLANAFPLAALYAALAFGYAIAFAVTKRADITYGAIFAFSGHTYLLFAHIGWDRFWLIFPAALAMGAAGALVGGVGAGVAIGRFVMRPLAKISPNAVIVASLGVLMVLMEGARLASDTRELWLPPFMNEAVVFWRGDGFPVILTRIQLINVAVMLAMIGAGHLVLARTRWGRMWRAVADDPLAAELSGTDASRVFVTAYASAALFASICGVLATSHYGTMDFGAGLLFGLKVVLIAAAGGHSNPLRSAAGAAVVGFAETLWSGYGPIVWRDFVIVSILVAVLVMSRRERAVP
ncbi:branched-chain amino acid ABC transporter permease [Neorhizobium sp. CSC1952]|uniref:Branched-chain amino acid transport system permease protein n=1 Tax=Xaviernesmea oryzae TaxID=464029 RepID=A0A1X7FF68_9HYPH|nr:MULTISPECIES: branched-chain amino acid ABC transporter permease [Rhizobium/Agrobacterium group]WJR67455.1 branched-chain amino acid ABC transporter permease [Rhizobium sp. CSC1952]SMF50599.1 branched-chain amino acid transport system permease protein [Xaviernesmea oryzae]